MIASAPCISCNRWSARDVLHQSRRRDPAASVGARAGRSGQADAGGHIARPNRAPSDRSFLQPRSGAVSKLICSKLAGCVRQTLCWRAAPSGNADLTAYGAVLGNFPSILESWRSKGCRAELFYPAHDPVMDEYGHGDLPIDVLFVGGYFATPYRPRQDARAGCTIGRHSPDCVLS
jgi:hypothetical protein